MMILGTIKCLKKREFEFLAGLNSESDEVRGRVIGKEAFSSIVKYLSM